MSNLFDLVVSVARVAVMLVFTLSLVPILVWAERKGAAYIQDRRGPNRHRHARHGLPVRHPRAAGR